MQKTIIDPQKKKIGLGIKELYQYKDLFLLLAYRDYRVRYAQTFLGFAWAFLQPLATLLIFALVFGRVARVDTGDIPYPLFAICGMAAWSYFSYVLSQSGTSIIGAQNMIQKIYFPRIVIPLSKAIVGFIDFFINIILVLFLLLYHGYAPSGNIIFLPIFFFVGVLSALAVGIWLSALTIRYRDFQHVVPFMVQFGLYITPIAYPASMVTKTVPDWVTILYFMNPMAGVVEGFRWAILGTEMPSTLSYISYGVVFVLFITGLLYFKRIEKIMADIV